MDDIVVWGQTREEHDARLKKVLEIIKNSGLKLNDKKCMFCVNELTYLGEKLTSKGLNSDPQKVAGIEDMPIPDCKLALQRALGMVNYLAKYVPNYSIKTKALRELLQSEVEWQWEDRHTLEWQTIKHCLKREALLKYFDPTRDTKVSSDASEHGIGAVLLQEHGSQWLPVAFILQGNDSCRE